MTHMYVDHTNNGEGIMGTLGAVEHTQHEEAGYSYAEYVAAGGRIDEGNHTRVMDRVHGRTDDGSEDSAWNQTNITAEISGISFEEITRETGVDPRRVYALLRNDMGPADVEHHHAQMSDQQLLVEALRMLGREDAVNAIMAKHPHIQFS